MSDLDGFLRGLLERCLAAESETERSRNITVELRYGLVGIGDSTTPQSLVALENLFYEYSRLVSTFGVDPKLFFRDANFFKSHFLNASLAKTIFGGIFKTHYSLFCTRAKRLSN